MERVTRFIVGHVTDLYFYGILDLNDWPYWAGAMVGLILNPMFFASGAPFMLVLFNTGLVVIGTWEVIYLRRKNSR